MSDFNWNGYLGGSNTTLSEINSRSWTKDYDNLLSPFQYGQQLVDRTDSAHGGTLRVQFTREDLDTDASFKDPITGHFTGETNYQHTLSVLHGLVDQGEQDGVKIQFAYRVDSGGGGGTVLANPEGSYDEYGALHDAREDVGRVAAEFQGASNVIFDTVNEPGEFPENDAKGTIDYGGGNTATIYDQSQYDDAWRDFQVGLIRSIRYNGFHGQIAIEDNARGTGVAEGVDHSDIVKYADDLNEANASWGGSDSPLLASVHDYWGSSDRLEEGKQDLFNELSQLGDNGFDLQIGEVGDSNWKGDNQFNHVYGREVVAGVLNEHSSFFEDHPVSVLPWYQEENQGRTVGFDSPDQQVVDGTTDQAVNANTIALSASTTGVLDESLDNHLSLAG